jgi:hypothetical protein
MIAWRIQEQFYGGHDKATLKLLDRLARGETDGFIWRDESFSSLSAVARAITGTSWNGRRFFGLRTERKTDQAGNAQ